MFGSYRCSKWIDDCKRNVETSEKTLLEAGCGSWSCLKGQGI